MGECPQARSTAGWREGAPPRLRHVHEGGHVHAGKALEHELLDPVTVAGIVPTIRAWSGPRSVGSPPIVAKQGPPQVRLQLAEVGFAAHGFEAGAPFSSKAHARSSWSRRYGVMRGPSVVASRTRNASAGGDWAGAGPAAVMSATERAQAKPRKRWHTKAPRVYLRGRRPIIK